MTKQSNIREPCLFCNKPNHPEMYEEYVCDTCTNKLQTFSREELKRGLQLAQEYLDIIPSSKGMDNLRMKEKYKRKKKALQLIMEKENEDGKQHNERRNITKCSTGARSRANSWHFKKRPQPTEV